MAALSESISITTRAASRAGLGHQGGDQPPAQAMALPGVGHHHGEFGDDPGARPRQATDGDDAAIGLGYDGEVAGGIAMADLGQTVVIGAFLRRRGLSVMRTWTEEGMAVLRGLARSFAECRPEDYWRGELGLELRRLSDAETHLAALSDQLDAIGKADPRVRLLMEQDGVGPRLAETVVAFIDDLHRFATGKKVGAYAGLAARVRQSGKTSPTSWVPALTLRAEAERACHGIAGRHLEDVFLDIPAQRKA